MSEVLEIKELYKDSPLGEIPESWEVVKLGEVTEIKVGRDLLEQSFSKNKNNEFIYPVYSNSHQNKGLYGYYNIKEYTGKCVTVVGRGDVGMAFSREGSFGAIGRLIVLFPNEFLHYKFLSDFINFSIRFHSESSAVPQLTGKQISTYDIALPPLPEQQKIAEILSTVDEKIEVIAERIVQTQELKKGLMQKLLTKGIGHTNFKESPIGEIPESWEVVKQSEVATFYNGRAYKLSEWENKGTPVIRLQNLTGTGDKYYYSKLSLPEHQYCHKGDLLYMWSASFGPVWWEGEKAIFHYHIWKIETAHNRFDKNFHYYLLDRVTTRMKNQSHGSTMLHVTKGGMEQLEIQLPPLPEQQKIAEILSSVDDKIDSLKEKKEEFQVLKKGLMQQLLTGKMRVKIG